MAQPEGISLALGETTLNDDPTWVRLDDPANPTLVASYQIDRGRPNETQRTDGSSATVVISDRHGLLDPSNELGPYHGEIEPLVQAAIARWNPVAAEWDTRFRGFVAEYDYTFDPSQQVNQLTLTLVDLFEILQAIEMQPGQFGATPPTGSEGQIFYEDTVTGADDRVVALLDDGGIPAAFWVVFSLNVDVHETTYSPGETLLSAIQEATDAELPETANAYVDRLGRLAVHGRVAKFDPGSVAVGAGDTVWDWHEWHAGDGAAVAVDPSTVAQLRQFAFNRGRSFVVNSSLAYPIGASDTAIAAQTDSTTNDPTSIGKYGFRSWTMPNLITKRGVADGSSDLEETKRFAQYKTQNYKQPRDRITTLAFRPLRPDDERAPVLHRLLGKVDVADQIDVTVASPGGGGFDTENVWFVEGIHETVSGRLRDGVDPGDEGYDNVTLTLDVSPGPVDTSMFS